MSAHVAAHRWTCAVSTTGPRPAPCTNPVPHQPHRGCYFVTTYVPDLHDASEGGES